jgi:hypothetical protein
MKKYLFASSLLVAAGILMATTTLARAADNDAAKKDDAASKNDASESRADSTSRGKANPEQSTRRTKSPEYVKDPDGTYRSIGLKSFEGIEEPVMKYVLANNAVERDDFISITDMGDGVVRMFLRYRGEWWDGDQDKNRKDRQRAEIKGLGPHQKDGETFEYGTTFRTDPDFKSYGKFCHVFQLKATDGNNGGPLVVLSIMPGENKGALRCMSGKDEFQVAREFTWKPDEWTKVRIRVKTTEKPEGELTGSINGDEFKGLTNVPMFRPQSTDYRPKWGLYRGIVEGMRDDWVEHKDATARKL